MKIIISLLCTCMLMLGCIKEEVTKLCYATYEPPNPYAKPIGYKDLYGTWELRTAKALGNFGIYPLIEKEYVKQFGDSPIFSYNPFGSLAYSPDFSVVRQTCVIDVAGWGLAGDLTFRPNKEYEWNIYQNGTKVSTERGTFHIINAMPLERFDYSKSPSEDTPFVMDALDKKIRIMFIPRGLKPNGDWVANGEKSPLGIATMILNENKQELFLNLDEEKGNRYSRINDFYKPNYPYFGFNASSYTKVANSITYDNPPDDPTPESFDTFDEAKKFTERYFPRCTHSLGYNGSFALADLYGTWKFIRPPTWTGNDYYYTSIPTHCISSAVTQPTETINETITIKPNNTVDINDDPSVHPLPSQLFIPHYYLSKKDSCNTKIATFEPDDLRRIREEDNFLVWTITFSGCKTETGSASYIIFLALDETKQKMLFRTTLYAGDVERFTGGGRYFEKVAD